MYDNTVAVVADIDTDYILEAAASMATVVVADKAAVADKVVASLYSFVSIWAHIYLSPIPSLRRPVDLADH